MNELNRHILSRNLRIDFVHQNILGNEHLPNLNFVFIGSSFERNDDIQVYEVSVIPNPKYIAFIQSGIQKYAYAV